MSKRTDQVGSTITRLVGETLNRGLSDPRIKGMVTITETEVTKDLKLARIKVTILPLEDENITMHGLRSATRVIRKRVMQKMSIREMPQLQFVVDEGMKAQIEVHALLARDRAEQADRAEKAGSSWSNPAPTAPPATPPSEGDA